MNWIIFNLTILFVSQLFRALLQYISRVDRRCGHRSASTLKSLRMRLRHCLLDHPCLAAGSCRNVTHETPVLCFGRALLSFFLSEIFHVAFLRRVWTRRLVVDQLPFRDCATADAKTPCTGDCFFIETNYRVKHVLFYSTTIEALPSKNYTCLRICSHYCLTGISKSSSLHRQNHLYSFFLCTSNVK